jgi:arabinan endo-1,5-alpha-L-arabinosidase
MARWRAVVALAALALLIAVVLLAVPSVRTALPGMTQRAEYTNPVIRWDFADPHVMKASDGFYYAYSTEHLTYDRLAYIQVARSRDLVNWELLPDAMPEKPEWANTTRDFWAPGVMEADGRYYMYFSGIHDERESMCLGVARSGTPGGPFVPEKFPLRCGDGFENIDPMPFDDPQTGKSLLYWGSDGAPISVQPLARDRLSFAPGSRAKDLVFPDIIQPYERLAEGAFVVYRDGYYYLFYSGDDCCSPAPSYAVMVARSRSAMGPFEKRSEKTGVWGSNVILQQNDRWEGTGHTSVVRDEAGRDWIFYHAIDPDDRYNPGTEAPKRPMLMDPIVYRSGWPEIEEPSLSTTKGQGPLVR